MDRLTIVIEGLGNATHVLANADGDAVVIDPPRDAWRIAEAAAARGWRLTHSLETHVHNDYLSGALELRAAHGTEILAPAGGGYAFPHRAMDGGDELAVGDLLLRARPTPGHTPEHLAWDVLAADTPDGDPLAVATGGSLLSGSVGRTDLLGPDRTDALSRAQADSLRALAALPDATIILPTHGAGSFCGAGPSGRERVTTIGAERRDNPLFGPLSPDAFVARLTAGFGPYPTYYAEMAPINRAGPPLLGGPPRPPSMDGPTARGRIADGVAVVDARPRRAFAAGHIPGSLNVELSDSFGSYVGWFVPFGAPLLLVLPEPREAALREAIDQLLRIGYDDVVGVIDGGVEAWRAAGDGELASFPTTTLGGLRAEAGDERGLILDVRDPREWREEGFIPGALAIPVGELQARLDELPSGSAVTVLCRSGARASVAASILDAHDIDVRLVASGGAPDWDRPSDPAGTATPASDRSDG